MLMKSDEKKMVVTSVLLLLFSVVLTVFGRIFSSPSSHSDLTLEKKKESMSIRYCNKIIMQIVACAEVVAYVANDADEKQVTHVRRWSRTNRTFSDRFFASFFFMKL